MEVVLNMFRELARLGVSRAAAFFYAVAVGVVANIVIAHLSPHDGAAPTPPTSWPTPVKPETPVAATVAPRPAEAKPAEAAHAIEASAPATSSPVPLPAVASPLTPVALPPMPPPIPVPAGPQLPPAQNASAALPSAATMAPPLLKPTAVPSAPASDAAPSSANASPANPPASAPIAAPPSAPVAADAKATPDKSTNDVEAAAGSTSAAPISLLPTDATQPAAEQEPPKKPSKPGPGSGGLY